MLYEKGILLRHFTEKYFKIAFFKRSRTAAERQIPKEPKIISGDLRNLLLALGLLNASILYGWVIYI